jgi:hypothetical protein
MPYLEPAILTIFSSPDVVDTDNETTVYQEPAILTIFSSPDVVDTDNETTVYHEPAIPDHLLQP